MDTADNSEGAEDDPPSSSALDSSEVPALANELQHFLSNWQQELQIKPKYLQRNASNLNNTWSNPNSTANTALTKSLEEEARQLFVQGTELEKNGDLYGAIKYYRKAMQLVPDIELKIDTYNKHIRERQLSGTSGDSYDDSDKSSDESEDENIKDGRLFAHIQRKINKAQYFCDPKNEQRAVHISAVPSEILLYILKWVVSSDLDIRSLEMCSEVSRGFYLLSRDTEIWRLICKVGGLDVAKLPSAFASWREMYLDRKKIFFNGCYISKTTYIRHGENSFQDQFYRPVHIVAYYRYLRFFPDGRVLMLNTPDEPSLCVTQLRHRAPKTNSAVLIGNYLQHDDKLTIVVAQQHLLDTSAPLGGRRGRRGANIALEEGGVASQTFHLELLIQPHNKQRAGQLTWRHYSVVTQHRNGTGAHCAFDIDSVKFPSLRFSRVKSYTQESTAPLG